MAKKKTAKRSDFIVKDSQSFIERENRTTVWSILAIVVIVAIVAAYLRVQQVDAPWLDRPANLGGLATESFEGEYVLSLVRHDVLRGQLDLQGIGPRTYVALTDDAILYVTKNDGSYEAPLHENPEGIFTTTYPDGDRAVQLLINAMTHMMQLKGLLADPDAVVPISLVPSTLFDAERVILGKDVYVQYLSSASSVMIRTDGSREVILLTPNDDGALEGTFTWDGQQKPIIVDQDLEVVILKDLY